MELSTAKEVDGTRRSEGSRATQNATSQFLALFMLPISNGTKMLRLHIWVKQKSTLSISARPTKYTW